MRSRISKLILSGLFTSWITGHVAAQSAIAYRDNKEFDNALIAYQNQEYIKALDYWLPLARHDDLAAQRNIGHLHRRGLGVPQSFDEAFNWYQRAAEKGLSGAQANLADMYDRGQGRPRDARKALQWFLAAAEQGHVIAQFRLGLLLMRGDGVEKRTDHALQWFDLAAKSGYEPAKRHSEILRSQK